MSLNWRVSVKREREKKREGTSNSSHRADVEARVEPVSMNE